ncbi:hypothetical protein J6590_048834 [Homalodisca vitripennis]|nr:hypothetical protein J6590_048834 [Homalodisca vitripennis]
MVHIATIALLLDLSTLAKELIKKWGFYLLLHLENGNTQQKSSQLMLTRTTIHFQQSPRKLPPIVQADVATLLDTQSTREKESTTKLNGRRDSAITLSTRPLEFDLCLRMGRVPQRLLKNFNLPLKDAYEHVELAQHNANMSQMPASLNKMSNGNKESEEIDKPLRSSTHFAAAAAFKCMFCSYDRHQRVVQQGMHYARDVVRKAISLSNVE